MDTLLFAAFAAGYVVLVIWGMSLAVRHGLRPADVLLVVVAGLIYDNGVLAVGQLVGEGPLLEALSVARFWVHAFATPLLVFFAVDAMARAGLRLARQAWVRWLALVIYAGLVVLELVTEVRGLSLRPNLEYGVLSYTSAEPASGPPAMIIGVSVMLLLASIVVWWTQRWPWFFVGVAVMTAGSFVTLPVDSAAVTNAFEFVLLVSLLLTKHHQDRLAADPRPIGSRPR